MYLLERVQLTHENVLFAVKPCSYCLHSELGILWCILSLQLGQKQKQRFEYFLMTK